MSAHEERSARVRATDRFKHLPEPIAPEQLRASQDLEACPDEMDHRWREITWLIRTAG